MKPKWFNSQVDEHGATMYWEHIKGEYDHSKEVKMKGLDKQVMLDFDKKGRLIGVEILW